MDSDGFRDISVPYTAEEVEKFIEIFKTFPTCENGFVLATDLPQVIQVIKLKRTPEQTQAYIDFFNSNFGGKVGVEELGKFILNAHSTSSYGRTYLEKFDADGDGFISESEFTELLKLFETHEPKMVGKSFSEFVQEADTNADGKVSIEECEAWIKKYSN